MRINVIRGFLAGGPSSYYLLKSITTCVGRRDRDITLANDDSISRNHAQLTLENGKLYLEDTKSKYGTVLVRESKPTNLENARVELKSGDEILFGRFSNNFIVNHMNIRSAQSGIGDNQKKKLSHIFKELRLELLEELDNSCTHLTTTSETIVSKKLVAALSLCIPIVSEKYWTEMHKAVKANSSIPDYQDFMPVVKEHLNVSPFPNSSALLVDSRRRQLFAGKTFMFATATQMKEFELIISSGGGKVLALSRQQLPLKELILPNNLFVQPTSQSPNMSQKNEFLTNQIRGEYIQIDDVT